MCRPLADSEKLPVRSHRAAETPKSPGEDGEAQSASIQEPRKKNGKEKKEKKKDKDRDRKVSSFFIEGCPPVLLKKKTIISLCLADEALD